ncbi:ATP-binding protein [Endozoicomonas sp. 8E]|uniref:AAA family ATPase n=1 Tax=Endozoicomonas sp. 8E TaxID=3035692 RepID=UPI0029390FA9|nr:ATP-binding protein [Endozoicomonas sp. 8E]WOG27157.1 ATP-binding protein [Endozoicomonas sp. 8E]
MNKKAAHSYYDYELENGSKIAGVMAVLGANGAGKSNLLKPLAFLSWFIPDSFRATGQNKGIPIIPYLLNADANTYIELEFVVPKSFDVKVEFEFRYFIELNEGKVISESLKLKTSKLYSNVVSRIFNNQTKKYDIKNSQKLGVKLQTSILERVPDNCSIISYAMHLLDEDEMTSEDSSIIMMLAAQYFRSNRSNIGAMGRSDLSENIDEATQFYIDEPGFFEKIKSLLIKYDLGISDIILEKKIITNSRTGKEIEKTIPFFLHSTADGTFEIPIFLESSGTQSAYCVLAIITEALATGGVAILDEFDNDLHPLLTMEIVDLFKDSSVNTRNAQLLFNTHTVDVLKNLRMQHCYLIEKNDGVSDAYRADDVEGLLARDNLYAKYISGALGAIPEFD